MRESAAERMHRRSPDVHPHQKRTEVPHLFNRSLLQLVSAGPRLPGAVDNRFAQEGALWGNTPNPALAVELSGTLGSAFPWAMPIFVASAG